MRAASVFIFLLSFFFTTQAEEFTIFEKDGFFGVKDINGEITVPPVYDRLGWSDHTQRIKNGLIGFRENDSWGLLSVRNKRLSEAKYYSLEPFGNGFLKGSIKGKFSNYLFYGLLDASGKTVVSFNYFSLTKIKESLLVSKYEEGQKFGVVTYDNKVLTPLIYEAIEPYQVFLFASRFDGEFDLLDLSGSPIVSGLDSLVSNDFGYFGYQNGNVGFVDSGGVVKWGFEYKCFDLSQDILPVAFPKWDIYYLDSLLFETSCDSIQKTESGLWSKYLNGAQHIYSVDSSFHLDNYLLMDATDKNYLLKDTRTQKWTVISKQNEKVLTGFDSIVVANYGFWAKKEGYWSLLNRYGSKKNRFQYQALIEGVEGQFIVKMNGHWGILDPLGSQVTPFKYDAIQDLETLYQVSYLGRQGLLDKSGSWVVRAEYDEVTNFSPLLVGRKGYGYSYFKSSDFLFRSILKPIKALGEALLVKKDSLYGLLNWDGKTIAEPQFENIIWRDGYYELLKEGIISLIDVNGEVVYAPSLNVQETKGYAENYFLVKKNNRWGFLDFEGRLRISNRYDSAELFNEGLAPIMLKKKWGFINKEEQLVIQPYYDEVSSFSKGYCIVRIGNKYGLIDRDGKEVVKIQWKNISRLPTGNYLIQNEKGKYGLTSSEGKILFRPSFESIKDFGNKVVVSRNGAKGVLSPTGNQLFKLEYKEVRISGDYTILKH